MAVRLPGKEYTNLSQTLQAYQAALSEAAIVSITDTSGKIIYVNDKFVEISKYSADELIGKTHRVVNSGYHPHSFFKEMWQTISSGKNWRAEIRNRAKDGACYWVDTVIAPVLNQQGKIFQYLSIRNLITVQKEHEEKLILIRNELNKRNQQLKDAQHMAKAGSWYLDLSLNLLDWSDETYNIFEVPAGTPVTYESFLEKVHPLDQQRVNQAWNKASKEGKYEIEHRIITKSGYKWVKEWARFRFDDSHIPISALGTVQDITEKKKSEDELIRSKMVIEESELKFRTITNQATEGIALADMDGNYRFVNPAFCKMTGYTEEELLSMKVFDLTARSQPHSVFYESKREKQRLPVEVNLRRKDGSEFMTEIIGTNMEISGQHLILGTVRDISERKNAEKKLIASEIRFRRLFETAKDGIIILNAETGAIEDVNPYLIELLNYSYQEFLGKKIWEIGLFKDLAANNDIFIKLLQEDHVRYDNLPLLSKRGLPIRVEFVSNKYDVYGKQLIQCTIHNITARKMAEEKLVNSEAQYKDLVENITDLICTHDLDGRILSLNAAAEKAIGIRFNPFENFNIRDILVPEFTKDFNLYISGIRQYGHVQGLMKIRTMSGEIRIWEYNNSLKTSGKIPVVRGYAKDITDRKKAEATLRKTQKRIEKIVSNVPVGILLHGRASEILFSNESALAMLGLTEDQLLGKTSFDPDWNVVHEDGSRFPGSDHPVPQAIVKKEAVKNVMMGVYRPRTKDKVWLLVNAIPELDANGNVKEVICTFSDITELKKAEQQLIESENRLRTIVQTEPECVKILNLKGELLSMNPAGLAMIEADHEEQVLGHQLLELINPDYRSAFRMLSNKVLKGGSGKLEFTITGLKGSHRWLETHVVPLRDSEGKIISVLGVTRDITERKKVEEEIRNTTRQLRLLAAHLQSVREEERKRIGREIHDELGQQLTAIKMDIAWIDKKITADTPLLKDKLKNVICLLDGSNQSIRRILSELRPGILDDRGLLESIEWLGRQLTANTGIPVQLTADQTEIKLPESISTCIFRICQEALTNIIRYAQALHVWISLRVNDDMITVRIEDDGKGFDPSKVQNNKSFGILGMKERVLSLGGTFDLSASPGAGTKIMISLPLTTNH